jgi:hypothetical protein
VAGQRAARAAALVFSIAFIRVSPVPRLGALPIPRDASRKPEISFALEVWDKFRRFRAAREPARCFH